MPKKPKTITINTRLAEELFTDRVEPQKAFWEMYSALKNEPGSYDIIHYYGEGGIGKTTLLKKIMEDLVNNKNNVNVIMYSFQAIQDKSDFLTALAKEIMSRVPRADFTLFYYAYVEYLKKRRLSDNQIKDEIAKPNKGVTATEALKTALTVGTDFMPLFGNTIGLLGEAIIDKTSEKIEEKNAIEKIDERIRNKIKYSEQEELLKTLHEYFVIDCEKIMSELEEPFVIMLDGYEFLNDSLRYGDLPEDLWITGTTNKPGLITSIPNVLWVIAGREEVQLEEEILPHDHRHLLGTLSEADTKRYLSMAKNPEGNFMDEDLKTGLYTLTTGMPVFLDLCFEEFEIGVSRNLDDFGKDTADIAKRYLEHMTFEQQHAMRFLCGLTDIWSDKMIKRVLEIIGSDNAYATHVYTHLETIKKHTFVDKLGEEYKLHDLLRKVVRERTNDAELKKISDAVNEYLMEIVCDKEGLESDKIHALLLLDRNVDDYLYVEERIREQILSNIKYLKENNLYRDYYRLAGKLVAAYEVITNTEVADEIKRKYAQGLSVFSIACYWIGDVQKALEYAEKAYSQFVKVLGEDHPDTIGSLNNLANCYSDVGNYEKALEYAEKVYSQFVKVLGEDHPDTINSLNNLANRYSAVGKYEQALEYAEKAYSQREKVLGEEHPETIRSLNILAICYSAVGDYEKALEYGEKAYSQSVKVLGEEHPETIRSLNNLAIRYSADGKYEKALEYAEKVYSQFVKVLGEDHPDTINSLNNLANCYSDVGKYEQALEYAEKVYNQFVKVLGEDHPDTINSLNNLANRYCDVGNYEKALEYGEKAYSQSVKELGEDHPDTIRILGNLANRYCDVGNYEKALEYAGKAYSQSVKVLGEDHPDTIRRRRNLSDLYHKAV